MANYKLTDLSEVEYVNIGDTQFNANEGEFMIYDGSQWQYSRPSFYINDANGEHVLEITGKGEVIWHGEPTAAAKAFCDSITFSYEIQEGFKKSRKEWQESHRKSIYKELEDGKLTKERIDEIFDKHKFHGRLKGEE